MTRNHDKLNVPAPDRWFRLHPNLIPHEFVSEILAEALQLQSHENQKKTQDPENCTVQELEKIAQDVDVSEDVLRRAIKIVRERQEQQKRGRQQKEQERQARRDLQIAMFKQISGICLVIILIGVYVMEERLQNLVSPPVLVMKEQGQSFVSRSVDLIIPSPLPSLTHQPTTVAASPQPATNFIQLPDAEVYLTSFYGRKTTSGIGVFGRLKSTKFCKHAGISFRVYDSDGNQLGFAGDGITNLKAAEVWSFAATTDERGAERFEVNSFSCKDPSGN